MMFDGGKESVHDLLEKSSSKLSSRLSELSCSKLLYRNSLKKAKKGNKNILNYNYLYIYNY